MGLRLSQDLVILVQVRLSNGDQSDILPGVEQKTFLIGLFVCIGVFNTIH